MTELIGVPMGDPAGIGPEVLVAAFADPGIRGNIPLLAIGHEGVLQAQHRLRLRGH